MQHKSCLVLSKNNTCEMLLLYITSMQMFFYSRALHSQIQKFIKNILFFILVVIVFLIANPVTAKQISYKKTESTLKAKKHLLTNLEKDSWFSNLSLKIKGGGSFLIPAKTSFKSLIKGPIVKSSANDIQSWATNIPYLRLYSSYQFTKNRSLDVEAGLAYKSNKWTYSIRKLVLKNKLLFLFLQPLKWQAGYSSYPFSYTSANDLLFSKKTLLKRDLFPQGRKEIGVSMASHLLSNIYWQLSLYTLRKPKSLTAASTDNITADDRLNDELDATKNLSTNSKINNADNNQQADAKNKDEGLLIDKPKTDIVINSNNLSLTNKNSLNPVLNEQYGIKFPTFIAKLFYKKAEQNIYLVYFQERELHNNFSQNSINAYGLGIDLFYKMDSFKFGLKGEYFFINTKNKEEYFSYYIFPSLAWHKLSIGILVGESRLQSSSPSLFNSRSTKPQSSNLKTQGVKNIKPLLRAAVFNSFDTQHRLPKAIKGEMIWIASYQLTDAMFFTIEKLIEIHNKNLKQNEWAFSIKTNFKI